MTCSPIQIKPNRWFLALIVFLVLLGAGRRALALDVRAVNQDGVPPPEGALVHVYHQVEVAIHDQVAAARTLLQFRNGGGDDLEVSVTLALGRDERIDGFSYWNGTERIVGEVLEKQVAEQVYRDLTGVRRDPGIVEQDGDRFRFRVYPVKAGETKPVEVRSVAVLERSEGVVEYRIPRENLPQGGGIFAIKADITDDLPIRDVETVGFRGRVHRFGPRNVRVSFEGEGLSFDRDLVIRYRLVSSDYGLRFVAHRESGIDGSFMLIVSPRQKVERNEVIGRDIVFVIDISGSMSGEPLAQARRGLVYAIEHLGPDDRFDVVAFDDDSEPFYGVLRPAGEARRAEAAASAGKLKSRGGTNIKGALARALEILGTGETGRSRAIIFLTDGQGSTPAEVVLAEVRRRAQGARVYSFGAGNGVNRAFLQRLARDNRGAATFVQHASDIEKEMRRLFDRISMPLMVDLELSFEGLQVTGLYPRRLPDLYRDGEVVVFGRYSKPGRGTVHVRGRLKDRPVDLSLDLELPEIQTEHGYLEKLWAVRRVEHLLDMNHERQSEELVQEVTRLGIIYNLVTPYTTFLAVPESLKTSEIKEKIRRGRMGYERRIIDSLDGIRLSQVNLPPGDPVLTVLAPENARKVVAYFPFGLVKRLRWDPIRKRWHVRFLVPRDVRDGVYLIRVQIVDRKGRSTWKEIPFKVDGTAPEFEASLPEVLQPGDSLPIEVDPFEPVREVFAWFPKLNRSRASARATSGASPTSRVHLILDPETGTYTADIPLPDVAPGTRVEVRVVVRDLARNRFERTFIIEIAPVVDDDGC